MHSSWLPATRIAAKTAIGHCFLEWCLLKQCIKVNVDVSPEGLSGKLNIGISSNHRNCIENNRNDNFFIFFLSFNQRSNKSDAKKPAEIRRIAISLLHALLASVISFLLSGEL